ncbi:MAG TPA: SGNH/GDSL hydrolase family protein [Steroidobacteraceae bacterium]|nr:SGNH/GDSL hydrolase family protein [Steroidobacteraceae bacterium]
MNRSQGLLKLLGALLALSVAQLSAAQSGAPTALDASGIHSSRWVATWSAAPQQPGPMTIDAIFGGDKTRTFENQTIRHIVHTSVGGRKVRVRVSNAYGFLPLRVGAASVARRSANAAIQPGTSRRLTFSGQASILIPAGAVAVSDAVDLDVPARADLAVSVYLPTETEPATYHETTMRDSYIAAGTGNFTAAADLPGATVIRSTYYLSVVEVLPSESIGTLVALGDSITVGAGSSPNLNRTWPDLLSARLNPNPSRPRLAVINQGIGCGRLLWDFCGPSGAARFDRDVLSVAGLTGVIVHLGLNDITIPSILPIFDHPEFAAEAVSANEIIVGLHQLTLRARARGVPIFGATITPIGSSGVPGAFTPENEAKRQAVNQWIRTSGAFSGVIDFDAAVRDPANPARLLPIYDSDGIHLTDAGYAAMANAVNLSMLF